MKNKTMYRVASVLLVSSLVAFAGCLFFVNVVMAGNFGNSYIDDVGVHLESGSHIVSDGDTVSANLGENLESLSMSFILDNIYADNVDEVKEVVSGRAIVYGTSGNRIYDSKYDGDNMFSFDIQSTNENNWTGTLNFGYLTSNVGFIEATENILKFENRGQYTISISYSVDNRYV